MKHWQLFLLLFVLPFALNFTFIFTILLQDTQYAFLRLLPVWVVCIWLLQVTILVGWHTAVYRNCIADTPVHLRPRTRLPMIAGIYVIVYSLLLIVFWFTLMRSIPEPGRLGGDLPFHPAILLAVFPLHILTMLALIYFFVSQARVFKTWELQREVYANDYIGEVFMFAFWIIGIWFVQPKLNLLAQGKRPVPWYPPHPPGTPPQAPPPIPHDF